MKRQKWGRGMCGYLRIVLTCGVALAAVAQVFCPSDVLAQLPPDNPDANVIEVFPASPFILSPFIDALPQPQALLPGWRPDPTLPAGQADWTVRRSAFLADPANPTGTGVVVPGPAVGQQDVYGPLSAGATAVNGQGKETLLVVDHAGTHQVWPNAAGQNSDRLLSGPTPSPILYHIRMQPGLHRFTTSLVRAIDKNGGPLGEGALAFLSAATGRTFSADGTTTLPDSTVWGFNGTFPGPMINGEYGKPALVRFENDLDKNPLALDYQDFGAPDLAFLTHQHNGHTAPESDGQPHYMQINEGGYTPGDWVDNLYLGYPAGGDPSEMQSLLWFHDHRMHHTGANVYKGMVGLFPMYDPGMPDQRPGAQPGAILPGTGLDTGNEADPAPNLKLPGVRTPGRDPATGQFPPGPFNVKYDIPLAFYDTALDDGLTPHGDMHTPNFPPDLPSATVPGVEPDVFGAMHPEWWGKSFFKHYPDHGFVGDIFTVNGVAYPVLHVEPRRYRLRFLCASVARIYELALMTSANGPQARPGTQGQWQIPDGVQWKPWTWVASMGGLLPQTAVSDTFLIWPATRAEFVVDFSAGVPADKTIFITNVLVMVNGRKPDFNDLRGGVNSLNALQYKVPVVKIVVDLPLSGPDQSDPALVQAGRPLRPMPKLADLVKLDGSPSAVAPTLANTAALPHAEFTLNRSGQMGMENQWLINDSPFVPDRPLVTVRRNHPEVWTNTNGGGGWVHPMHMHMEEHTTLARQGSILPVHVEDTGKEDVTNLEPGESVSFYRNFRTFEGRYVAHCHNLAHEDHNMMFGFTILPPDAPPPTSTTTTTITTTSTTTTSTTTTTATTATATTTTTTIPIPLPAWWVTLDVSHNNGPLAALELGQMAGATDNFDGPAIDGLAPPQPPAPNDYDAYFSSIADEVLYPHLLKDYRALAPTGTWRLVLRLTAGDSFTGTFGTANAQGRTLTWQESDAAWTGSGPIYPLSDAISVTNSTGAVLTKYYVIRLGDIFTLTLSSGWNLISLPLVPVAPSPAALFGTNMQAIFSWDGQHYVVPTVMQAKTGYWVYLTNPATVTVVGAAPADGALVHLVQGWNLVGPVGTQPVPGLPVIAGFGWDGTRYVIPTNCVEGRGYWLYAVTSTDIWTGAPSPTLLARRNFALAGGGWSVPIGVTLNGAQYAALELGVATGATNNYDAGVDGLAPPPAPAPIDDEVFFSSITSEALFPKLLDDYRNAGTSVATWRLRAAVNAGKSVVISWPVVSLPSGWGLTYQAADSNWNGTGTLVSMAGVPQSLTLANSTGNQATYRYLIVATETSSTTTSSTSTTTTTLPVTTTTIPVATTTTTTVPTSTTTSTTSTTTTSTTASTTSTTTTATTTTTTTATTTTTIPKRITVLFPSDSGICLKRGKTYKIAWTSNLPKGTKVRVDLVKEDGRTWALSTGTSTSPLTWTVGKVIKGVDMYLDGDDYRIRVSTLDGIDSDESDDLFSIYSVTGIEIRGATIETGAPDSVAESSAEQFTCRAILGVGDPVDVTADVEWKVTGADGKSVKYAKIGKSGLLVTLNVSSDQACSVTATYGKSGVLARARQMVTIKNR